jgi:dipeptidase
MRILIALLPILTYVEHSQACTSLLVTCKASLKGFAMLAHAADCNDCDTRMAMVPNRKHNDTALHAVRGMHHSYPREWSDRATVYFPPANVSYDTPLGFIPEVNETYAIWEAVYGLMNEHGLSIGESSTYARINAPGVDLENPNTHNKGPALFSIAMLIQVAMERCKTAECAVMTMGDLSYKHGFYAETFNAGESLSIIDTTGDGWIFHILPDPTGLSSVWCARRVPDGHVAALANQFTISTIDKADSENYRYSENMYRVAEDEGLWDGKSKFHFNRVFGTFGKLPMYASLRLWWIYNSVAPSLKLTPHVNPFDFPFSVPVDAKVSVEDIMAIYRSHYEGTDFDMTKGILAGPFSNPFRIDGGDGVNIVGGQITRPISIQRTAYSIIGVADPNNPMVLYASDTPSSSVYVPFLASTLKKADPSNMEATKMLYSDRYQVGEKRKFDRYSAWWAFDFVANWMNINYRNMSSEYVYPAVELWQPKMLDVAATKDEEKINALVDELIASWWDLADKLVVRYNDGYYNFPESAPEKVFYTGYPAEYLRLIGFNDGFVYPLGATCGTNSEQDILVDLRAVNETVEELHYLKEVVLPEKFAKSVIVNITESGELIDTVTASAVGSGGESKLTNMVWSVAMIGVGVIAGFMIGRKKDTRPIDNEPLYSRIIA